LRFVVGVLVSDAAEGDGDGGASEAALLLAKALLEDGLEILVAAEARFPRKALDCFSRYDDMMGGLPVNRWVVPVKDGGEEWARVKD
jgi:hypothetical protein